MIRKALVQAILLGLALIGGVADAPAQHRAATQRQIERLDRGIVAVHQGDGKVFVGWRLLATDPPTITFNIYRATGGGELVKLNAVPIDSRK